MEPEAKALEVKVSGSIEGVGKIEGDESINPFVCIVGTKV